MSRRTIGKLPPRYSFAINPYGDTRFTRCPKCDKPTHARKFPLFIHIDDWGPLVLGKTCRYCTPCELIIVHQNELEAELAFAFSTLAPAKIGNRYLVLGTMEKRAWKSGLTKPLPQELTLDHVAGFQQYLVIEAGPSGGWLPPTSETPPGSPAGP